MAFDLPPIKEEVIYLDYEGAALLSPKRASPPPLSLLPPLLPPPRSRKRKSRSVFESDLDSDEDADLKKFGRLLPPPLSIDTKSCVVLLVAEDLIVSAVLPRALQVLLRTLFSLRHLRRHQGQLSFVLRRLLRPNADFFLICK